MSTLADGSKHDKIHIPIGRLLKHYAFNNSTKNSPKNRFSGLNYKYKA